MTSWQVEHLNGPVGALHERSVEILYGTASPGRLVRVMEPVDQALVLGSTQSEDVVDLPACAAAGVQVVRRRSGGGAVLVQPGAQVWVDVVLPAGDVLWCADVGRAAWWVGQAWAAALGAMGTKGVSVWTGPMLRRPWSSLVCFAGLAPGEVSTAGGGKIVGISQRRARTGTLFQCSCLLRWEPAMTLDLLALSPDLRARAARELAAAGAIAPPADAAAICGRADAGEIVRSLVAALPPAGRCQRDAPTVPARLLDNAARPASNLATGTRNGEHDT